MRARGGSNAWAILALLAVFADLVIRSVAYADAESRPAATHFETVGAGRCSATACHGSAEPVAGSRILRNEHTVWAGRDPHARAYQLLHSAWSRTIAGNLGKIGAVVPAHRDRRCLACDATPGPSTDPALAAVVREDGVGCESCHGPAGSWLALHTTYDWDGLPPLEQEQRFGMVRTADLARRAEACAGCHVGETGREVDHDLIAAGHPRLAFEFAAYVANLPAHWIEKEQNAAADFPARAWAVGQAVTAKATVELLHERARGAAGARGRPWPEFAEYDCASCHHELRSESRARAGVPSWGGWALPMTT